jgi:hypothetical protein
MHTLADLAYLPLAAWQDQARELIATALAERYQRVKKDALLDRGDVDRGWCRRRAVMPPLQTDTSAPGHVTRLQARGLA